MWCLTDKEKH